MTPRKEIIWLEVDSAFKTLRRKIEKNPHSYYPVCQNSLDKVVGIIRAEDLLTDFLVNETIDLHKSLHKPLFIPTDTAALKVLELFKKTGVQMAIVVDEYGSIEGLVSLSDILEAIVGDIPRVDERDDQEIVKRDNNSWLIDGLISIDDFKEHFKIKKIPGEKSGAFHTLGGFTMNRLGRIPLTGDSFEFENLRFEVMDMDGNRVDKVLIEKNKRVKK